MKITGFCPIIVTKDQESAVKTFEALGFERRHKKTDIEAGANEAIAMKDAGGNRISIASTLKDQADITAIQINVDNFQEAYDFFKRDNMKGGTDTYCQEQEESLCAHVFTWM